MRTAAFLLVVLVVASGCAAPDDGSHGPRRSVGRAASENGAQAPDPLGVLTEELNYTAPALAGPWMAAYWLRADRTRTCNLVFERTVRSSDGVTDTILMVAEGWKRPDVRGRIIHDLTRGDGYVLNAATPVANHTLAGPKVTGVTHQHRQSQFRVDLPPVAFLVLGNSYMPNVQSPSLALRMTCDQPFRLVHHVDGASLSVYGPEEFSQGFGLDTAAGFGAQREMRKTIHPRQGLVALLHEDANQGNAQYTTTKPDGTQQVDTLGNRIALGPPGAWRFHLNRVSAQPGGEFRLFAWDLALPTLDEPSSADADVDARPQR